MTNVSEFKYLGSTMQSSANHDREEKRKVEWMEKITGVICNRRVAAKLKE